MNPELTPEEVTKAVAFAPDLYKPDIRSLSESMADGFYPINITASHWPNLEKLATPRSDKTWWGRFRVSAKKALGDIMNRQLQENVVNGAKKIALADSSEEIEYGRAITAEALKTLNSIEDEYERLTPEDADSWAAALGGGATSMAEFVGNLALLRGLGAGKVVATIGSGVLAGEQGYEEGVLNDISKYIKETGDTELTSFSPTKKQLGVNIASGAIQGGIEAATMGLGKFIVSNPISRRVLGETGTNAIRYIMSKPAGRALAAGANESVNNAFEEWSQGLTGNLAEIVKGNEEWSKDALFQGTGLAAGTGALLGWMSAPVMHEYGRRKNIEYVSDLLRNSAKQKNIPITEREIKESATNLIDIIESKGAQNIANNLQRITGVSDPNSKLAQHLANTFRNLVAQGQVRIRGVQNEDELNQLAMDWANYMQAQAIIDSINKNRPITSHELFKAVAKGDRIYLGGMAVKFIDDVEQSYNISQKYADDTPDEQIQQEIAEIKEKISRLEAISEEKRTENQKKQLEKLRAKRDRVSIALRRFREDNLSVLRSNKVEWQKKLKERYGDNIDFSKKTKSHYISEHGAFYINVKKSGKDFTFRFGSTKISNNSKHKNVDLNIYYNLNPQTALEEIDKVFNSGNTSLRNVGFPDSEQPLQQPRIDAKSLRSRDNFRGAYDPLTRALIFTKFSDVSTVFHESAHYWFDRNMRYYRSGVATPEWKDRWEQVMKAVGLEPTQLTVGKIRQASEKFARMQEKYLRDGKSENDAMAWAHLDYKNMVERIYRRMWNQYYDMGELQPAVKQWFAMNGFDVDNVESYLESKEPVAMLESDIGATLQAAESVVPENSPAAQEAKDLGKLAVYNPHTGETAIVPNTAFESDDDVVSRLGKTAQKETGVEIPEKTHKRRDTSAALEAAQKFVADNEAAAWDAVRAGQKTVNGLYMGDIYRALIKKYQAENNTAKIRMTVEVFSDYATEAGRELQSYKISDDMYSFEKTVQQLMLPFKDKKSQKKIDSTVAELKGILHNKEAVAQAWTEFKKAIECK